MHALPVRPRPRHVADRHRRIGRASHRCRRTTRLASRCPSASARRGNCVALGVERSVGRDEVQLHRCDGRLRATVSRQSVERRLMRLAARVTRRSANPLHRSTARARGARRRSGDRHRRGRGRQGWRRRGGCPRGGQTGSTTLVSQTLPCGFCLVIDGCAGAPTAGSLTANRFAFYRRSQAYTRLQAGAIQPSSFVECGSIEYRCTSFRNPGCCFTRSIHRTKFGKG